VAEQSFSAVRDWGTRLMWCRLGALVFVLAIGAGTVLADDKDKEKKEGKTIKGSVSKFDKEKHSVTLKSDDGEKDYALAEEVVVVFAPDKKVTASTKATGQAANRTRGQGPQILAYVLKNGNKVEIVVAEKENKVTEIHFDPKGAGAPQGKPAGAPGGAAKEAPKKDDGKN
jgi:hypothetical protein